MHNGTRVALLVASAVATGMLAAPQVAAAVAATAPGPTTTTGCVLSVPELGTTTPVKICYSLFKPVGADAHHRVPMVFHSHGWGASRTTNVALFGKWMRAGFGVLSFDQRGFGESGGKARAQIC